MSEDMPIGIGDGWRESRGSSAPGDALLLVSDGVLELWGGSFAQLSDAVGRFAQENLGDPQGLIDALCAGAGVLSDSDDVTAVMLQRQLAPLATALL